MSDYRRSSDPVDDAIVKAGGYLGGVIVLGAMGIFLAQYHKQYIEQWFEKAALVWPETFEIDLSSSTSSQAAPYERKQNTAWGILITAAIFLTIGYFHNYGGKTEILIVGFVLLVWGLLKSQPKAPPSYGYAFTEPEPEPEPLPRVTPDDAQVYTITLPKDIPWQPELARAFMEQILQKNPRLTFQIVAERGVVSWRIADLRRFGDLAVVEQAVRNYYPDAVITQAPYAEVRFTEPFWRCRVPIRQNEFFVAPRRTVEELKQHDPLVALTQEMSSLQPGERIVYTVHIANPADYAYQKGLDQISIPEPSNALQWLSPATQAEAAYTMIAGKKRLPVLDPPEQKLLEQRVLRPLYHAVLLIQIDAASEARVNELYSVATHVTQFRHEDFPGAFNLGEPTIQAVANEEAARRSDTLHLITDWIADLNTQWRQCSHILVPEELAALWHLPNQNFTAADISWVKSKQVRVTAELAQNQEGICLGDNATPARTTPISMPYADRTTHMAVVGATGTGKSNFLHSVIAQDIANGKGVCVVDPLGSLVSNILRFSIPTEREDDLVILDVADEQYPPPLNIMSLPLDTGLESATSRVLGILAKLFPDMPGTRWADTLAMALLTLQVEQTPTIRDVSKILSDVVYRDRLLDRIENEAIHDFWEEFERKSPGMQDELTDPIKRRLRAFYGNAYFYPISCHPQGLDFTRMLQEGKVILLSLGVDESKLTTYERRLLGALIISQIQMAATSHACEGNGFYLFVDEAQEFITTSLPTVLTQARQFNLSLTLANQYFGQLVGDTLEAIRGDMGAFVFFQLGDQDAGIAARYTRPNFEAEHLMNLDKYQAAVRLRLGTTTMPGFSLTTRLAVPTDEDLLEQGKAREAHLRAQAREVNSWMKREEVLEWLKQRYPRRARGSGGQDDFSDPV